MTPEPSSAGRLWSLTATLGAIGLLLVSAITLTASRAALASTNVDTFELDTEAENGRPLFELDDLAPGRSATNCMVVDNLTPGGPGILRVYSGGFEESGSLSEHLEVTIEEGTGGVQGDCTGFVASATIESGTLSQFDATHTDYSTGVGMCSRSTEHSMTYRITFTLDPDTPNDQQGAWIRDLSITWETQIPT